jgi:hypothetical protein
LQLLQQLEAIQKSIEPLQDGILRLAAVTAATTNEIVLRELNSCLEEFRKSERELRERLFVIQVAKKFDWEAANKMARRKAGEYDDPELAKVLEEREKREEREKKEKARLATSMKAKRGGRFYGGPSPFRGAFHNYVPGPAMMSPHYSQDFGAARRGLGLPTGPSFGSIRRRPPREDEKCHTCNQTGHFWKYCPNKK